MRVISHLHFKEAKVNEKKLTAKEPKPTAPTNAANQPSTRFGSAIVMFTSSAYWSCLLFFERRKAEAISYKLFEKRRRQAKLNLLLWPTVKYALHRTI